MKPMAYGKNATQKMATTIVKAPAAGKAAAIKPVKKLNPTIGKGK